MYAIVEIAGMQVKVEENQKVIVNRLEAKEGEQVEFDKVLLKDNNGKVEVGTPVVNGAKVSAKVLSHLRGDKVIVFKKKRRKGYQKQTGFRADLTQIQIEKIA
ncbi:MAG: 50S ribosomal protein L21 [Bacteroidales bacterium]|nr:50S ribosomal protein L21 [Bacteroidales bacterium]MDE6631087.1 50S ribosomal protein L21 [Bacteroidales bacterium]MDE7101457.1 50S ribosomal protein L21 [Bacteroidales bacterium]MDE7357498.1 50S ribosomal protein L21 [Bacteroidales bacterium]